MRQTLLATFAAALLALLLGACGGGAGEAPVGADGPFTGPALVLFLTDN